MAFCVKIVTPPALAVDEALDDAGKLAGDEVVAVEELGVLAEVDQRGQRLGVACAVVDVLEAHDGEVVVGVGAGEARGAAVVGARGPSGLRWILSK